MLLHVGLVAITAVREFTDSSNKHTPPYSVFNSKQKNRDASSKQRDYCRMAGSEMGPEATNGKPGVSLYFPLAFYPNSYTFNMVLKYSIETTVYFHRLPSL
jgi:hypothetical protein